MDKEELALILEEEFNSSIIADNIIVLLEEGEFSIDDLRESVAGEDEEVIEAILEYLEEEGFVSVIDEDNLVCRSEVEIF